MSGNVELSFPGGGAMRSSPGVLISGQAEDKIIEACLLMWRRDYPWEWKLFMDDVNFFKDTLKRRTAMSEEGMSMMNGVVPPRMYFLIEKFIPDMWEQGGNGIERFYRVCQVGKIKGPK